MGVLLAGATGIGFAPIFVRLSGVGPSATAAFRILLALPILWLLVAVERGQKLNTPPRVSGADFKYFALAGLFFTGDLAIWHWSLKLTTVANSTLLSNLAPVLVTIGGAIFFAERLSARFLAGLLLAISGAALLVLRSVDLSAQRIWGDLLAIVTALFYAAYLLSVKNLRRRFSTVTIMAWSGLVASPALFIVAILSGERILPPDLHTWHVLIGLAVISHVGGQTLIAFALGHLPASFSSVSLLWQPVVAALLAAALLHERLAATQILGGAVTLIGIILASRASPATPTPPAT